MRRGARLCRSRSTRHDRGMIERLLALSANVDAADRAGRTPLDDGREAGRFGNCCARCSSARNRRKRQDAEGRSAAHHAIAAGHYDAFEFLLAAIARGGRTDGGRSAIYWRWRSIAATCGMIKARALPAPG